MRSMLFSLNLKQNLSAIKIIFNHLPTKEQKELNFSRKVFNAIRKTLNSLLLKL